LSILGHTFIIVAGVRSGVKAAGAWGWQLCHLMCRVSGNSGSLKNLQP